jgi:hypothetical protein
MEADEAHHVAFWRVGRVIPRTIHSAGRPSAFAANWPAETSSPRASRVTVDRSQAYGPRDARAEDKKKEKSSNGEGVRWQEQNEGESTGGKNGGVLR